MKSTKFYLYIILLFISVIISAISQLLLKKSANKKYKNIIYEYLNPLVIISYTMFFLAIVLDMISLKEVPVSFIPIIESSSYIFIIVLSRIFLKEEIDKRKIIGIFCIIFGIVFYLL